MADDTGYEAPEFGDVGDIVENLEDIGGEEVEEEEPKEREVGKENRALLFLTTNHPECRLDNLEEVQGKLPLQSYPPDHGRDSRHVSVPYLTIYERTDILGKRAQQLAIGGRPYITVPAHVTDVIEIARLELEQKRLPIIIKRPMPDGSFEYVRLSDLLVI
jgi:DNA-directed RNA polymerase I, II, and III subunit RPABC2